MAVLIRPAEATVLMFLKSLEKAEVLRMPWALALPAGPRVWAAILELVFAISMGYGFRHPDGSGAPQGISSPRRMGGVAIHGKLGSGHG